jgi:hypothetical protein
LIVSAPCEVRPRASHIRESSKESHGARLTVRGARVAL